VKLNKKLQPAELQERISAYYREQQMNAMED
jgi:hypothetical protein